MKEPRQTIKSQVEATDPKGFQRGEKLFTYIEGKVAMMLEFSIINKVQRKQRSTITIGGKLSPVSSDD